MKVNENYIPVIPVEVKGNDGDDYTLKFYKDEDGVVYGVPKGHTPHKIALNNGLEDTYFILKTVIICEIDS